MSSLNQKTIKKEIILKGIGLHSGNKVTMKILPGLPNTGILFKRIDLKDNNLIIPNVYNVSNTSFCTTISNEHNVTVSTIEHLMGAFYGMGIDNAVVEIDNKEVPILDGSAKNFVDEIMKSGFEISNVPIKIIKIKKEVTFKDNQKIISISPSNLSLDIDFEIKYDNRLIGTQQNTIDMYKSNLNDIYNSRTFCLFEDIEKLKSNNLAKGGSLKNAIVVKKNEILNEEKLRNKKEFVNHKILDCMGDLFLSGFKMIGSIKCSQGGHMLTNKLLRKVFDNKDNFSIVEVKEKTIPHTILNKNYLRSIA